MRNSFPRMFDPAVTPKPVSVKPAGRQSRGGPLKPALDQSVAAKRRRRPAMPERRRAEAFSVRFGRYTKSSPLNVGVANQKPAFPAKAGIHLPGDGAVGGWVPAFAGNADFLAE